MDRTKQYGHFSEKGETFFITEPETPRHWYNYMYNDEYITFTSQVGYGEGGRYGQESASSFKQKSFCL